MAWEVKVLQLQSPDGDCIEIKSNNLKIRGRFFDPFLIKGLKYSVRN